MKNAAATKLLAYRALWLAAVVVWTALAFAPFVSAQSDEDCEACHSDPSLTRTLENGAVQSLCITGDSLTASRHASLTCIDCHADLKGFADFPHAEKLKAVSCAACHGPAAKQVAMGSHESAVKCAACHGTHNVLDPADNRSPVSPNRINRACADCHNRLHIPRRGMTASYSSYDVGLHGSHPVAGGAGGPNCVVCHGTHNIACERKRPDDLQAACLKCHPQIQDEFRQSVHADLNEGRANSHCFDCHGEHRSRAPSDTTLRVLNESPAEATCGSCHARSVARYNQSLHAYALAEGSPRAPRCESCHGAHNIRSVNDPLSPVHRSRQMETCAKCHSRIGITTDPDVRMPRSFENYAASTHGQLLAQGNAKVPICTDCHGGHAIRPGSDPQSTISPLKIDQTCGRCHDRQQTEYRTSIHYRALKFGIGDSPTCTGCHGEHLILAASDPKSSVNRENVAGETCGKCHENPDIIRKYGLSPDVVSTYRDSYHGLATRGRSVKTPMCADCHMAHAVRTARDSLSTIHPANVVETCGKCHPKADANFAQSYTHKSLQPRIGGINYWIARVYWVLLAVIIGGMVLHNLVILNFHLLRAKEVQERGKKVTRFDTHQLIQHMALTVSFILLALTGFALKYPDAWWVRFLSALGLNEATRRILHRIMAVVLIACGVYHVIYLFFTRRGREEWRAMVPNKSDVTDLRDTMAFHTRLSSREPRYGRYDYSQKAEYWALIWGTLAMIATGFVLWFPAELSPLLPRWAVSACQTVHFYEAWLATLAIVVWHFFFVIFHPEEYPMSWTWLTGKISLDQVKHRHGRWYDSLVKREKPEPSDNPPEKE